MVRIVAGMLCAGLIAGLAWEAEARGRKSGGRGDVEPPRYFTPKPQDDGAKPQAAPEDAAKPPATATETTLSAVAPSSATVTCFAGCIDPPRAPAPGGRKW